jgi:hypothetical protein
MNGSSTRTQGGLMVEQRVTFSGKRLAVKDRRTAVPIFYRQFFTSQVSRENGEIETIRLPSLSGGRS